MDWVNYHTFAHRCHTHSGQNPYTPLSLCHECLFCHFLPTRGHFFFIIFTHRQCPNFAVPLLALFKNWKTAAFEQELGVDWRFPALEAGTPQKCRMLHALSSRRWWSGLSLVVFTLSKGIRHLWFLLITFPLLPVRHLWASTVRTWKHSVPSEFYPVILPGVIILA